ncbi:hypothetical protein RJT34_11039 [Clitoria ternatea]|uniref:Pentatricopeptide repeat-containing protein n=1 Tax=Clitoria ternatea TaxID=43366 RepID=A0AAN9JLP3_CLITE
MRVEVEVEDAVKTAAFVNLVDPLCREGFFGEVFGIAEELPFGSVFSQEVAYGQIIDSLCKAGSKDGDCMRAYQLLEEGAEFGFVLSEHTYKVLVEALCRILDVDKAREVLKLILRKEDVDKSRIYNIHLRALCLVNNPTELLNVLVVMLESQCQANVITLNTFSAPDVVTFTTVIPGLLDTAKVNEALDLGLFKLERPNDALEAFDNMVNDGIAVDSITFTVIVEGLCESDQIVVAKRFWRNVIWPSGIHDYFVYAAILKGLCHSGKFNEACHFLYELRDEEEWVEPDAVTWRILDKLCGNTT